MDKITVDRFNRFKDAEWFDMDNKPVLIGGTGGIGSWLTIMLLRNGFKPYVFDFDILESHNIGGQLYSQTQVGMSKVEALNNMALFLTGDSIEAFNEKVTRETLSNFFVFSCFDNMQARKDLFESWVESNEDDYTINKPIFIDGRLSLEQMQIFCVEYNSTTIERYRKYLFDDNEVEDAPCTARQTSPAAAMIAAKMASYFVNHIVNIKTNSKKRTVPFYHEHFLPLDLVSNTPEE